LKGKWSIRQIQGFHSNTDGIIYPLLLLPQTLNSITLHSYSYYHLGESIRPQRGRKTQKGSQVLHFCRFMPKGEKIFSPKQKDRTTISKILKWSFNWYLFQLMYSHIGINWYLCFTWFMKVKFQINIHLKTLLLGPCFVAEGLAKRNSFSWSCLNMMPKIPFTKLRNYSISEDKGSNRLKDKMTF
jgi:hypothetical protein